MWRNTIRKRAYDQINATENNVLPIEEFNTILADLEQCDEEFAEPNQIGSGHSEVTFEWKLTGSSKKSSKRS